MPILNFAKKRFFFYHVNITIFAIKYYPQTILGEFKQKLNEETRKKSLLKILLILILKMTIILIVKVKVIMITIMIFFFTH